ncbi:MULTISPECIES: thioesterase II family protein [Streptomyces]|uniref:thioesterase II family protein n=1 Tax=Streptomyces TaxID=1883 RepID=UPI000690D9D6|nr:MULTISPECIES: thioesterase domain-containing protein [Streptomyces]QHF95062.1 thioesterase [Streptomyces sp. NHF165]
MAEPKRPRKWLLRSPGTEAPARLFLLPYSGVGASMYNRWPERIGPAEVCRIQLPGRENRVREEHYGTYPQLAGQLAEALLPYLDRPFGFFGHCGGALPGFATALLLAERGLPTPSWLFVSSQVAPHLGPYGRFLSLPDDQLRDELRQMAREMGGDEPQPDMIELGMRVLRADLAANRAYRLPAPVQLPCTVHTLSWTDDHEIRPEQMTGWDAYAAPGRFRTSLLPGGHFAFLQAPEALRTALAGTMTEQPEAAPNPAAGIEEHA